jgi:hypothetical protein
MSAAPVLGATMPRCPYTGLTIPECCCRRCCEEQLRRYAPWLLRREPEPTSALWTLSDFAAQQGVSTVQLHEQASRREIPA